MVRIPNTKKGHLTMALVSNWKLRGKDLNLRPLGYEPLFPMDVLVISAISVSSISVYFGLFWRIGPVLPPRWPRGTIDYDQNRVLTIPVAPSMEAVHLPCRLKASFP